MEVTIHMHRMKDISLRENWYLYTDVECSNCEKNQLYIDYKQNDQCIKCDYQEDIPLLVFDNCPVFLEGKNKEEINEINDKLESFIVTAQMMGYDDYEIRALSYDQPFIRIHFQSAEKNKLIQLIFILNRYGKFKKVSLRHGRYKEWGPSNKLDSKDIVTTIEEAMKKL